MADDKKIIVKVPLGTPTFVAENFIREKKDWITNAAISGSNKTGECILGDAGIYNKKHNTSLCSETSPVLAIYNIFSLKVLIISIRIWSIFFSESPSSKVRAKTISPL